METRIALIGIIVEDKGSAEKINALLHQYGTYVIGRMGIPNQKHQVSVMSVVLDAPMDVASTLSGKLGMLTGVSVKTIYAPKHKEGDA